MYAARARRACGVSSPWPSHAPHPPIRAESQRKRRRRRTVRWHRLRQAGRLARPLRTASARVGDDQSARASLRARKSRDPARARGARAGERTLGGRPGNHGGCGERSGGARRQPRCQMAARSSLLRRPTPGARPARRTSSVVAALAALAPRLVRLAHHDYPDRLLGGLRSRNPHPHPRTAHGLCTGGAQVAGHLGSTAEGGQDGFELIPPPAGLDSGRAPM